MSSRAVRTSCGAMVFLVVRSSAAEARWEMNTEEALVMARRASLDIEVLGGREPRARRERRVRGRSKS